MRDWLGNAVFVFAVLLGLLAEGGDMVVRCRTGTLERRVREVPAKIQEGVFSNPETYLDPLVEFLIKDVKDEFLKVKLIHDWIADNIGYSTEAVSLEGLAAGESGLGFADVLRSRKSVCEGFTTLFQAMCGHAGIESEKISGWARGYGFNVLVPEDPRESNHAWNAVRIHGEWHLLDVTWDAGHRFPGRAWEKDYTTAYLFLEPKHFIYTHLPLDSRWQLIEPKISDAQFAGLPYLRGEFFSFGLELLSALSKNNRVKDTAQAKLRIPENVEIAAYLESGVEKLPERAFLQQEADAATLHVTFPKKGAWLLQVLAKHGDDPGDYGWVASFGFEASGGTALRFPTVFGDYGKYRCTLLEPLHSPLSIGKNVRFRLRAPGIHSIAILDGQKKWTQLKMKEDGVFEGAARVVAGPMRVYARAGPGSDEWVGLLEYDSAPRGEE
jgi:hypothetical protein